MAYTKKTVQVSRFLEVLSYGVDNATYDMNTSKELRDREGLSTEEFEYWDSLYHRHLSKKMALIDMACELLNLSYIDVVHEINKVKAEVLSRQEQIRQSQS